MYNFHNTGHKFKVWHVGNSSWETDAGSLEDEGVDTQSGEGTRWGGQPNNNTGAMGQSGLGGTTSWFILPCERRSWPRTEAALSLRQRQRGLPHQ